MLKCQVRLPNTPSVSSDKLQDGRQVFSSSENSESCLVLLESYHLNFFSTQKEHMPIYQVSVRNLRTSIDSKSNLLTISSKKSDSILLEIYSDIDTLNKIEKYCHQYSDEASLWNLLVFSPHNAAKQAFFSDRTKTSPLTRIVSRSFDMLCLMLLISIVTNFQYAMDGCDFVPSQTDSRNLNLVLQGGSWVLVSLIFMITIEKLAFKKVLSKTVTIWLEAINILTIFCAPMLLINNLEPNRSFGLLYSVWSLMIALKMISYVHFMHELRGTLPRILRSDGRTDTQAKESLHDEVSSENLETIQKYANNISDIVNLRDVTYFLFTPVLVYQLWYPRTEKTDWLYVAKLSMQFIPLFIAMFFWLGKYLAPALKTLTIVYHEDPFLPKVSQILIFCGCFIGFWIIVFFCIFHVFMTLIAEVLRFGDQEFYKDWWQGKDSADYWNKWNRPVHKWAQRHIYFPLQKKGYSKTVGLLAVFIFSGLLHEYLYCVPTGIFGVYEILWFAIQPASIILSKKREELSPSTYMLCSLILAVIINFSNLNIMIAYCDKYLKAQ